MGQFGISTRKWLISAIKQRKLLLKTHRSLKSELHVEMALELLDNLLSSYSYENDIYMARFILQNAADIEILLPGKGSTAHDKKHREYLDILKKAAGIDAASSVLKNRIKQTSPQYELPL
jgi:hypothetical protein